MKIQYSHKEKECFCLQSRKVRSVLLTPVFCVVVVTCGCMETNFLKKCFGLPTCLPFLAPFILLCRSKFHLVSAWRASFNVFHSIDLLYWLSKLAAHSWTFFHCSLVSNLSWLVVSLIYTVQQKWNSWHWRLGHKRPWGCCLTNLDTYSESWATVWKDHHTGETTFWLTEPSKPGSLVIPAMVPGM